MPAVDVETQNVAVGHDFAEKWQHVLDLMAKVVSVPVALIMRVQPPTIKVFLASHSAGNPYEEEEIADLGTGLYCETVMQTRSTLIVPNALSDPDWCHNPDVKLGMISYMGMPLIWPNSDVFGTICILDREENPYNPTFQQLLEQFRGMVERDLKQIFDSKVRAQEDAALRADEAERVRQEFAVLRAGEQKALQALKDSEERWHFALEGAGDGVWDWDIASGSIFYSNRCRQLLGLPEQGEPGDFQHWQSGVHPDELASVLKQLEHYLHDTQGSFVVEHRYRKEQDWIWLLNRGMAVSHDAQGRPLRMIGTYSDITPRKQAEMELHQLNSHLEERVAERSAELKAAMEQVSVAEKQASLARVVAGMAHELNTPIGNILLASSVLQEQLGSVSRADENKQLSRKGLQAFLAKSVETCELLERNSLQAVDLIDRFKQIAVDQLIQQKRRFDLPKIVAGLLQALLPAERYPAIQLKLQAPASWQIENYPGALEQLLTHLVSNSLTHGFSGSNQGNICVEMEQQGQDVIIRYSDDGCGIDQKLHGKVFDPFFTTRMGQGGVGLGLAMVHNIVQVILKGHIQLESQPGQGTRFTISFPADQH